MTRKIITAIAIVAAAICIYMGLSYQFDARDARDTATLKAHDKELNDHMDSIKNTKDMTQEEYTQEMNRIEIEQKPVVNSKKQPGP
jgi:hypothetical protein